MSARGRRRKPQRGASPVFCWSNMDESQTEIKAGARHSRTDQEHLDAAAMHLYQAGGAYDPHPPEPAPAPYPAMATAEEVDSVAYGDAVKALGGGRVGGYLVRYGDAAKTDLTGDYFTAATDYGDAATSDTYYHHGLDAKIGRRVIGKATLRRDDVGVWVEAQLTLRDEYEKAIYGLAEQGKLGWSSGTAAHLIEREPAPQGAATWIKRWPLGLDASLTPTPAEPRNTVIPLKSLSGLPGQAALMPAPDGATAGGAPATLPAATTRQEQDNMDEKELETLRQDQAAIKTQLAEVLTELRKPALNTAPPQVQVVSTERPFKTLGEQMFAIRDITTRQATEQQVNRQDAVRKEAVKVLGAGEVAGSDGGFLVQTEFAGSMFERSYATGAITSRCTKQAIGPGFNGVKIPAIDEQSRADGSRWGGVRAYWAAEGVATTASRPRFRMISLELKKLMCLIYGSDELLQDATAFEGYLNRVVPAEMAFKIEDAIIRGPGGGIPLGILPAPCLVTVAKEANQSAASIEYANVYKMWARMWAGGQGPNIIQGTGGSMSATVWLVNQDCLPALFSMKLPVGVAGSAVFLPPSGAAGQPYATLFGRPVIPVEQCATVGTAGDILLCDMSQYMLADKGGVNAAVSIHVAFLTDEQTFRWTFRTDGAPLWNTALTPYQGSNTQSPFIALAVRA